MSSGIAPPIDPSELRFACELPTMVVEPPDAFVTGSAVAEVARAAEAAGFDACYVTDHPAGDAKWLETGGHHALDPFVALSFAAAATSSLRLLTYVYVAAYRNPFLSAKAALSLDALSGGRLILGTAAGYLKSEFGALGVDFDERNELLDEAIDVMVRSWTEPVVAAEGRHFRARGVSMLPRPVSQPHPPIWMGGNTTRAIRRAVERCQGWAPFPTAGIATAARTAAIDTVDDLAARIDRLRQFADEAGRTGPFDICFSGGEAGNLDAPVATRLDRLRQLAGCGVTWVVVGFPTRSRAAYLDGLRQFGDEVIGAVRV